MENPTAKDIKDEALVDSFAHRIQEIVNVFGGRGVIAGMWQHKELLRRLKHKAARTAALERVAAAAGNRYGLHIDGIKVYCSACGVQLHSVVNLAIGDNKPMNEHGEDCAEEELETALEALAELEDGDE